MQKTKIFVDNHHSKVTQELNEFIDDNQIQILDLQFDVAMDTENDEMYFSIMIFYETTGAVKKAKTI